MPFRMLKRLGRDVSGATAVEYGLILALIFLAMLGAVQTFGQEAIKMWTNVASEVSSASKP
jgi:pilus assembly protein Flp/PilA